jgi:hypothetical protein
LQWLRKEIERRLDLVGRVKYEPRLVQEDGSISPVISNPETKNRMQAMDDVKVLGIFNLKIKLFIILHVSFSFYRNST